MRPSRCSRPPKVGDGRRSGQASIRAMAAAGPARWTPTRAGAYRVTRASCSSAARKEAMERASSEFLKVRGGSGGYRWWQRGTIYQVYPRSFMDSDNDGVGDLRGIVSRLDYVRWLGVDAIWISPIYPSPMKDFGYDVADYTAIHPMFGTLEDFDQLVREAHLRGLKVIL